MDRFSGLLSTILAIMVVTVTCQISTPCTGSMIASFTPCVNFITGSSANGGSPTASCCKAVESLMSKGTDCMCLIVTGNVPFSLPSFINQALAIQLPKACNSQSVPMQCKSTGVPLPPAGPALFVPPPPPRALPPVADSPDLAPIPSASVAEELAPTPSEMGQEDLPEPDPRGSNPVAPHASAPTVHHDPPVGSGIRPVLTPPSGSNQLRSSVTIVLLMLVASIVMNYCELVVF